MPGGLVATGDPRLFSEIPLKVKHQKTFHTLYLTGILYALALAFCYAVPKLLAFRNGMKRNAVVRFLLYGTETPNTEDQEACKDIEKNLPVPSNDKLKVRNNVKSGFTSLHTGTLRQFLFCFFGLQFCYLLWGVCQERMLTKPFANTKALNSHENNFFKYSQFLVFSNRILAFSIAFLVFPLSPEILATHLER